MCRCFQIVLLGILSLSFSTDCLIDWNRRNIGIREATGNNDGYYIQRFLSNCNLPEGYEWCAAYALTGHKECGFDYPTVNPCRADSWFPENRIVYKRGLPKSLIKEGQVPGYYIPSKGRIGHCGGVIMAVNLENNYALITEGNSRDTGNKLQPGDGVHLLRRSLDEITYTSDWQTIKQVSTGRYHVVQPKETLYRLTVMYGVTLGQLREWNNLSDNIISIGQRVRVG